jgi:hypothetical protein
MPRFLVVDCNPSDCAAAVETISIAGFEALSFSDPRQLPEFRRGDVLMLRASWPEDFPNPGAVAGLAYDDDIRVIMMCEPEDPPDTVASWDLYGVLRCASPD